MLEASERPGCWWDADQKHLGQAIEKHISSLHDKQSAQRKKDEIHAAMYTNKFEFRNRDRRALSLLPAGRGAPIKLNVIKSCIDTITARISLDIPMVEVAADNAEWSYKLKAKRLTRFITTKQEETGFRRVAPLCFRDMCMVGTGIAKVGSEHGEIIHERIPKAELYVDDLEGRYGHVRNIHQRKQYARDVLAAMFPKKRQQIIEAPEPMARDYEPEFQGFERTNVVDVFESIHTPSGPGEKGLKVWSLRNGDVLHIEPWDRPRLPYLFMHWSPPVRGFWGTGLAEELAPIQYSIDKTLEVLERGFDLGAPLRVFLQRRSKIVKTQLIANVGTIVECDGPPPDIKAPSNPVSQQQIQWLLHLIEWAYQISGVSQAAASAKIPAQMESGEAQRVLHEFETERFQHVEDQYQRFALDCAEVDIDEAKSIYSAEGGKKYAAKWLRRDVVEKINWKDIDLDREHFKLKLKPVSFLKGTIAARLDRARSLAQAGLVPPEQLLPLLDNSDLERFVKLETANFNFAEWFVEQCMDEDVEIPEPLAVANLEFLEKHTKAACLDSVVDNAPDGVVKRFLAALDVIQATINRAKPAMAAPMPGLGALPAGPAPTSLPGQALPGAPMAAA